MKEEHIVRRMLDVEIPGKRIRGRPNLRRKDTCKRDMTEMGLKEDKTTNRAAWRNTVISYTGDPRYTGQAREEEEDYRLASSSWKCVVYKLNPQKSDNPKDIIMF